MVNPTIQKKEIQMKQLKIKKSNLYLGQLVVTSIADDAQVRTVSHIFDSSTMVELQWMEGTNHCTQGVDYSLLMIPTIKQIENSIFNYGNLVSAKEIINF
jgi:hypothetical protein